MAGGVTTGRVRGNAPGERGTELLAERTASQIVEDTLVADPSHEPGALDPSCTTAFFDGSVVAGCPYAGGTLVETFGLRDTHRVNVTVRPVTSGPPVTVDGVTLARGDRPPGSTNVGLWTRIVSIDDRSYRLTVRIW